MIIRTRMIAMVMDMIHEVKKASTAGAISKPFPLQKCPKDPKGM